MARHKLDEEYEITTIKGIVTDFEKELPVLFKVIKY